MLMPAGSAGFAAWAVPRSAMVDSWIGALSGSSVHVPCVASLLLQGVEEDSRRLRVVAVVRRDHIPSRRMHVLAHRDRTVDVVLGAALRSEEHTTELKSLMRISSAVICFTSKKKFKHI